MNRQADIDIIEEMKQRIAGLVSGGVIPGASWSVVEHQKADSFYCGKQGVVSPYSEREIKAGMYYDLASLTKVIGTTTRIMQLLDTGRLTPDTKVAGLVERFAWPDITVEQLLLHNSGLPAEIRDKELWNRELLPELLYTTAPAALPGEQFIYSDVGYIMLGNVIEAVDQLPLRESLHRFVFTPLQMEQTGYELEADSTCFIPTECTAERGCICGTVHDKKGWLLGPCGSAGLFSTLADVTTFVGAYLAHSPSLFRERWFAVLEETEAFGRTYGWSKEYGPKTLYHTGFTGTSVLINQRNQTGFVLLTNRVHPDREDHGFLAARKQLNELFLRLS